MIAVGYAEIPVQHAFGPGEIAYQNGFVEAHLHKARLILLSGQVRPVQGVDRILRHQGHQKEGQKRDQHDDQEGLPQALEHVFCHGLRSFFLNEYRNGAETAEPAASAPGKLECIYLRVVQISMGLVVLGITAYDDGCCAHTPTENSSSATLTKSE